MRGNWLLLLLVCISCESNFFPDGLYHYQVERLLSGGSSKVWMQVIDSENCQDSTRLFIALIEDSSDDSLELSWLIPKATCAGFDTAFIGKANASVRPNGLLFADSLNFSDGDFWMVESITAQSLELFEDDEKRSYRSSF